MKTNVRNFLVAVLAIMPILFVSCEDSFLPSITGQGEIVTTTLNIDEFDGFVSSIAADVYITQGENFEVTMEAQQNIIENLDTDRVSNGIWTIKYHHWVRNSKPVKIFITIPTLTKASISGSGQIIGETPFTGLGHLDLSITGSGTIDLEVTSDEADLMISGSGDMFLTGITELLDCTITGSGSIHAFDMNTREGAVTVSGSGNARLNVEDYLDVSISGSGSVFYRGNPHVDSRITGSGKVKSDR